MNKRLTKDEAQRMMASFARSHAANRLAASSIAPFRAHARSGLRAILSAGPVPDFDDQLWG